ncbi:hypothetical protein TNCT6_68440 [Streptomyces sp. 6-11-2]|nr:hypothetical protein TNCT6_68440 [Streptomyces sp. 6-11-2]
MSRSPHSPYENRRGKRDLTILRIADVHRRSRRRPKAGARLGGVKRALVVDDAPTVSEVPLIIGESEPLEHFLRKPGQTTSREELMRGVWGRGVR